MPTLYVELLEGRLRYRLEHPGRDAGAALEEEYVQPVDTSTLRALGESVDAMLRSPGSPRFAAEMRSRGEVLYRTLVPTRLRDPLRALKGPLLLSTSLAGVHWELLHDGEEFWALRYALGKRILVDRPLAPGTHAVPTRARPSILLIGADPRHDLPFVATEIERLSEALSGVADLRCVSGELATFESVTELLRTGFDVVHYCGHVTTGAEGSPAFLLGGGVPLPASVIERTLTGRPLVFLNGCASLRGGPADPVRRWEEGVASLAHGFLLGGALAVVGTLCDVSDEHAAKFAAAFYRRALRSDPIGEALRVARAQCRSEQPGLPVWSSFGLYGNPMHTLGRAGAAVDPGATIVRPARNWPLRVTLASSLLALLILVGLGALARQWFRPGGRSPLVVGVMEVRAGGDTTAPVWMRELTRDALNTVLSKVPGLMVFAGQKIDFVREKWGMSEIEAAESLDMTKMVSVKLGFADPEVTLDVQVVDIASGMLEDAEQLVGTKDQLIELQNEAAMRVVRALRVPLSVEDARAIVSNRTNKTLEKYRLLSESLGDGSEEPKVPSESMTPGTQGWLTRVGTAWADELDPDETAIRDVVARYARALETRDWETLTAVQVDMPIRQREALDRYLRAAQGLTVRISNIDIVIAGEDAMATFTREDVFTDAETGQEVRLELRISGQFAKKGGAWRIRALRKPSGVM